MATDKPLSTEMWERQEITNMRKFTARIARAVAKVRSGEKIRVNHKKKGDDGLRFDLSFVSLEDLSFALNECGLEQNIVFTIEHDDENPDVSTQKNTTTHCIKLYATSIANDDTEGLKVLCSSFAYRADEMPALVFGLAKAVKPDAKIADNFSVLASHAFQLRVMLKAYLAVDIDGSEYYHQQQQSAPPVPITTQQSGTTTAIAAALTLPSQKPLTHAFGIPDDATAEMLKAEIQVIEGAKSDYLTFIGNLVLYCGNSLSFTEVSNTFKQIMMTHHKDNAFKESMNLLTRDYTTFMDFTENPIKIDKYRIKEALDAIKASKLNDNFPTE